MEVKQMVPLSTERVLNLEFVPTYGPPKPNRMLAQARKVTEGDEALATLVEGSVPGTLLARGPAR